MVAFSIKHDGADAALRELTALTGESLTTAVLRSIEERLDRHRRLAGLARPADGEPTDLLDRAAADLQRCYRQAGSPGSDGVDYDEFGLPV